MTSGGFRCLRSGVLFAPSSDGPRKMHVNDSRTEAARQSERLAADAPQSWEGMRAQTTTSPDRTGEDVPQKQRRKYGGCCARRRQCLRNGAVLRGTRADLDRAGTLSGIWAHPSTEVCRTLRTDSPQDRALRSGGCRMKISNHQFKAYPRHMAYSIWQELCTVAVPTRTCLRPSDILRISCHGLHQSEQPRSPRLEATTSSLR